MMVQRHDTGVRVRVYSHLRPGVPIDIERDALSLSTSHDFTGYGAFHVTLFPRREYLKLFRQNDWIEIYGRSGGVEELLLFGLVSNVQRSRRFDQAGTPTVRINITGQDFTKVLHQTEVFFDPLYGQEVEILPIRDKLGELVAGGRKTAGEIVRALVQALLNTHAQFIMPDGRRLVDMLDLSSEFISGDTSGALFIDPMQAMSGNLWNLVRQFSDPTNNYLFSDVVRQTNGPISGAWKPVLRLGRLPFDTDVFLRLPELALDAARDVRGDDIGFNDADTRNWFAVVPALDSPQDSSAVMESVGALVNKESIKRNGIRRERPQALYCTGTGAATDEDRRKEGSIVLECRAQNEQLARWYSENEYLLSGTLACRFLPQARVGMRTVVTDAHAAERIAYFTEAVEHSWQFDPPQSGTVLRVTRGFDASNYQRGEDVEGVNLKQILEQANLRR